MVSEEGMMGKFMMDTTTAGFVICLTIFIVIGINAAIYSLIVHGGAHRQIELLRKASIQARNPWELEDQSLKELNLKVHEFNKDHNEQT